MIPRLPRTVMEWIKELIWVCALTLEAVGKITGPKWKELQELFSPAPSLDTPTGRVEAEGVYLPATTLSSSATYCRPKKRKPASTLQGNKINNTGGKLRWKSIFPPPRSVSTLLPCECVPWRQQAVPGREKRSAQAPWSSGVDS